MKPTRLYVKPVLAVKSSIKIYAMTHITGGGFYENIPRALPEGITAKIDVTQFPTPAIFDWLQEQGNISTDEMYNIFNMGIGFTLVVDNNQVESTLEILNGQNIKAYKIGETVKGNEPIQLTGYKIDQNSYICFWFWK